MQNICNIYDLYNPPFNYRFPGTTYKKEIFLKIQQVKLDIRYYQTLINNPEELIHRIEGPEDLVNNPFQNIIQYIVDDPDRRFYYNRLFQKFLFNYQRTLKIF